MQKTLIVNLSVLERPNIPVPPNDSECDLLKREALAHATACGYQLEIIHDETRADASFKDSDDDASTDLEFIMDRFSYALSESL